MTEQAPAAHEMAYPTGSGHCDECGTRYPDAHATHCSANPDNLVDDEHPRACLWVSRSGIQAEIAHAASVSGAEVYPAGQWGDPDAQADVLVTPAARGIVTVHHDDVAEAVAHLPGVALVRLYPMPRARRAGEGIAEYTAAAMLAPDGSNREPMDMQHPTLALAIAHALCWLTD